MNKQLRRGVIILLVFLLSFSNAVLPSSYAKDTEGTNPGEVIDLELKEVDPSKVNVSRTGQTEKYSSLPEDEHDPEEIVRASIFLDAPSTIDAGFSPSKITSNNAAMAYNAQLYEMQKSLKVEIENTINTSLDVVWNLTLVVNAISVNVRYKDLEAIRNIPGVKAVQLENKYEYCDLPVENTNVYFTAGTSVNMVGAYGAWEEGYTGAGMRIAVIDSGLDILHQSFDPDAFEYAIAEINAERMGIVDGGELVINRGQSNQTDLVPMNMKVDLLTEKDLEEYKANCTEADAIPGVYVNSKIPYAYNYAKKNTDVSHWDSQAENHGSATAGAAAANRYIKNDQGQYVDARTTVGVVGMAPDAQILVMKVEGFDAEIIKALTDAILLECDAVNLSMGTLYAGSTYDNYYQDVMNSLVSGTLFDGMVVSIAAGNSYSNIDTYKKNSNGLRIEDVNYDTVASPGSLLNGLTVAASYNNSYKDDYLRFVDYVIMHGSSAIEYHINDNYQDTMSFYDFAGVQDYVYMESNASPEQLEFINNLVPIKGKIVIFNDFEYDYETAKLSYSQIANNLIEYEPLGLLIVSRRNSYDSVLELNLKTDDYVGSFPIAGTYLRYVNSFVADYYETEYGCIGCGNGQLTITAKGEVPTTRPREYVNFTDYSSWGVSGSLSLKPEITAPGHNTYTVLGSTKEGEAESTYTCVGGTSLAAPHIAGISVLLSQYIKERGITIDGYSRRAIVQSLLMSTATPMINMQTGYYYPIMQQGAGLADVSKALAAKSVIMMENNPNTITELTGAAADGKVKIELGDSDPGTTQYSYSFRVYNISDEKLYFEEPRTDIFTQDYSTGNDNEIYVSKSTVAAGNQLRYSWLGYDKNGRPMYSRECYVPAGGYADVTITFSFEVDNGIYSSGAYIEGFTMLKEKTPEGITHSIPILGFHGYWNTGSMYDYGSYADNLSGTGKTPYRDINQTPDTNYINVIYPEAGQTVKYAGNPYLVEKEFPYERLAFNKNTTLYSSSFTLIRPAGTIGTALSEIDSQDGNVIAVLKANSKNGTDPYKLWFFDIDMIGAALYFDSKHNFEECNSIVEHRMRMPLNSLELVEGHKYRAGVYAISEYDAMRFNHDIYHSIDDFTDENSGFMDDDAFREYLLRNMDSPGQRVTYDFVIDEHAPEITEHTIYQNEEGNYILHIKVNDNENIAYFALLTSTNIMITELVPASGEYVFEYDVTPYYQTGCGLMIFAGDYAQNEVAFVVEEPDKGDDIYAVTKNESGYSIVSFDANTGEIVDQGALNINEENGEILSVYTQFISGEICTVCAVINKENNVISLYTINEKTKELDPLDVEIDEWSWNEHGDSENYPIFTSCPLTYRDSENFFAAFANEYVLCLYNAYEERTHDFWACVNDPIIALTACGHDDENSPEQYSFLSSYYVLSESGKIYKYTLICPLEINGYWFIYHNYTLKEEYVGDVRDLCGLEEDEEYTIENAAMYYDGSRLYVSCSSEVTNLLIILPEYGKTLYSEQIDDVRLQNIISLYQPHRWQDIVDEQHDWQFCKIEWSKVNGSVKAYALYKCKNCPIYSGYIEMQVARLGSANMKVHMYKAYISAEDSLDGLEHTATHVFIDPTPLPDKKPIPSDFIIKEERQIVEKTPISIIQKP